jgi:selenocysteine lyase/cysteine desulfurase
VIHPSSRDTYALAALRESEYPLLDRLGHVYLDYTAGNLSPISLLNRHTEFLRDHLLGNPHSSNAESLLSSAVLEQARLSVLQFFNADPEEYTVVFTANATQALKLIGEAYPFDESGEYLLTFDNHNSVNGIREFCRLKRCRVSYVPITLPDMRVNDDELLDFLAAKSKGGARLFAYPAQSNFSGVQHPLEWIEWAHERGWDVLLDAAAFTPTNILDLRRWRPDFVSQSFYKMFGYPTGVGCLVARRASLAKLRRPWFSGGTISVASVQGDRFYMAEGPSAFEDGTPNYLALPAVGFGLEYLASIGIPVIHEHVAILTAALIERLTSLRHSNGEMLARLYGPRSSERRGGIVAFNLYDRSGHAIDHRDVEQRANAANISLRTGCFCNPGGGEIALGITGTELSSCFHQPEHETRLTVDDFRRCIDGKSTGAVRVSLGLVSNMEDVDAFVRFAEAFLTVRADT